MKAKVFFILFSLFFSVALFSACGDDPDGAWDEMEWSGYSKKSDIVINVGAEGGTNILHCKNYGGIWLSSVNEIENSNRQNYSGYMIEDPLKISTDWAEIQCNDAQLQVTMKPNDSGKQRTLEVEVTAGDIFDTITFKQAAE